LRARLAEGPTVLGTWVNTPSPDLVETLGAIGFDCVMLDLEHGEYGTDALPGLLRAARAAGCYAIVRTSHVAVHEVAAALDAGADGVLAPGVGSAVDAATVVGAAHYPPVGGRGAAPMVRAAGYGTVAFADYRRGAEDDVVAGVQIEGPDGLGALDAILATPQLGLAFIGPFDLSQHLGVPGETSHPAVVAAMSNIAERATAAGVATGTWAPTPAAARPWIDAGVRLVTVASTTALFTGAATDLLAQLQPMLQRRAD
jgi:2-keto-3-deoxy-L-rhamnonate aldolase RhmA